MIMIHRDRAMRLGLICCIAGALSLVLAAGCTLQGLKISAVPATPAIGLSPISDTVVVPPASSTVALLPSQGTAIPASEATIVATIPKTRTNLTLWTVEAVSSQAEGKASQVFENSILGFERLYPNVSISVKLKNDSGKGSVLDYLRTASQAAPSVLPDVVVLDTTDLANAVRAGVLVTLDGRVSPALINDLLPAARAAGTVDGQLVGIPFEADVEHLVYDAGKFAQAPVTWTDILSANTTYLFPAKGRNGLVNDSFLIQYFALGGRLQNDDGSLLIDEKALTLVLGYYYQGVKTGVIPRDVLDIGDSEDIWSDYASVKVGVAHVRARRFLRDQGIWHNSQYADIPTWDGRPLTICRGRALAITTYDSAQQAVAVRLIEWMLEPDVAATWSKTTASLPTRYGAFKRLVDVPYWAFLQHEMEIAVPPPTFVQYDQIGRVLQQSVVEVLGGDATPEEAAAAAVDAISR
jgi:ABC-type glycerol-3-phosphate transport system substrate-binding protein